MKLYTQAYAAHATGGMRLFRSESLGLTSWNLYAGLCLNVLRKGVDGRASGCSNRWHIAGQQMTGARNMTWQGASGMGFLDRASLMMLQYSKRQNSKINESYARVRRCSLQEADAQCQSAWCSRKLVHGLVDPSLRSPLSLPVCGIFTQKRISAFGYPRPSVPDVQPPTKQQASDTHSACEMSQFPGPQGCNRSSRLTASQRLNLFREAFEESLTLISTAFGNVLDIQHD